MSARSIQIPFVKGIEAAGDKSATTEPGKLDTVLNMHIRPEHADVFHCRPGFATRGDLQTSTTTVGEINGSLACIADNRFTIEEANGNDVSLPSVHLASELTAEKVEVIAGSENLTMGYADDGFYEDAVVGRVQKDWGGTTLRVFCQMRVNNIWQPSQLLFTHTAPNNGSDRLFVLRGSTFFIMFGGGSSSATPSIRRYSNSGGPWSSSEILTNAKLWDAVQDGTGSIILYNNGTDTELRVARVSSVGGISAVTVIKTHAPGALRQAGLVHLGGNQIHAYARYEAPESPGIWLINTTIGAASSASVIAAGSGTFFQLTVGGGPSVMNIGGGLEAASYCYFQTANSGRIVRYRHDLGTSVQKLVGYYMPRARLWTSNQWYGARLTGIRGSIYGMWHFTANPSTAQSEIPEAYPIVYHSVTLAASSGVTVNPTWPVQCSAWYSDTEARAIYWSENSDHARLAHTKWGSSTGRLVSYYGTPYLLSGVPRYWDGVEFVPAGIPQKPAFVASAAAAGTIPAGPYSYAVVWEYTDSTGRKQSSPPTIEFVNVDGTQRVNLNISSLGVPIDERTVDARTTFVMRVYRNDPNGSILRMAPDQYAVSLNASSIFAFSFTWVDTGTINYSSGEPLYTSASGAGELPNSAMENTLVLRGFSDRVLSVGSLWPNSINYSKTIRQGRALESNQLLEMIIPDDIVGMAIQDGNIFAFGESSVWGLVPSFADDTGQGAGGVEPIPLSVGVGCTQPLSIVETSIGIFFASTRGIYVIARGGGPPEYIGAPVEAIYRAFGFHYVNGSAHNPATHEVCWILGSNNDHRILVFNYQFMQWFTWRIGSPDVHTGVTTLNGGAVCLSNGFVFCQRGIAGNFSCLSAGNLAPSDTINPGGSRPINVEVTSRDIHFSVGRDIGPGNIGELTRVLTLALEASGGVVRISESHDSGSTWSTERLITLTSQDAIYQFVRQKSRGVRFRIRTTSTDTPPETMAGVTLRVAGQGRSFTANSRRRG